MLTALTVTRTYLECARRIEDQKYAVVPDLIT